VRLCQQIHNKKGSSEIAFNMRSLTLPGTLDSIAQDPNCVPEKMKHKRFLFDMWYEKTYIFVITMIITNY